MINQSAALIRSLKQFFDERIGLGAWERGEVKIALAAQDEAEDREYVFYKGDGYTLKAFSPDDEPPLGKIELIKPGRFESGPFSKDTLERLRALIINEVVNVS